jgi:hypothetical protein
VAIDNVLMRAIDPFPGGGERSSLVHFLVHTPGSGLIAFLNSVRPPNISPIISDKLRSK